MADCAKVIREALELTEEESKQVIRDLQTRIAGDEAARMNPELMAELGTIQAAQYKRAAKMAEIRAKLTTIKLADRNTAAAQFPNRADGTMAELSGTIRKGAVRSGVTVTDEVFGGLASLEAHRKDMESAIMTPFWHDMAQGDVGLNNKAARKMLRDPEFGKLVARETWEIADGKSVTGNKTAFHVAGVIEKHKEVVRVLANQEGADIAKLPGHVVMQSHDSVKMAKAGFIAWRDNILPRLDLKKTFGSQDPNVVLKSIYDKILRNESGIFIPPEQLEGKSLASRLGNRRFLHFQDADSWLQYHDQFGTGSIFEGVTNSLKNHADAIAIMQRWGPNPQNTWRMHMAAQQKVAIVEGRPITDAEGVALNNTFNVAARLDSTPGSVRMEGIFNALRIWQHTAKLGGAMLSSFSDIPNFAATSRFNGKSWAEGYSDAFTSIIRGVPKNLQGEAASYLATMSDGVMASMMSRISAVDMRPGKLSKLSNLYFKATGLTGWTDRLKTGFVWAHSRLIAREQGKAWGSLDDLYRSQMIRYGITEADWKVIQKANAGVHEGASFITPDLIPDESVQHKVRAWQLNEAEFAVPTPGVRERAIALQGTRPGTGAGELLRTLWQFKMFSLTMLTRGVPRAHALGVPGYVNLAVGGMLFGYMSLAAKDLSMGRKPRSLENPRTYAAALIQSGGMGILGDALFADFTEYGRGLSEIAGGPVVSVANDALKIYSKVVRGDDPSAALLNTTINNTPLGNLFYTRAAINYLFVYEMQEWLNPGYLRRMEKRMKRSTGQEFIVPPARVISQ